MSATQDAHEAAQPKLLAERAPMPLGVMPPGPAGPAGLQAIDFLRRATDALDDCAEKYGETFTYSLEPNRRWIFLSNPEDVKRVFTGSPDLFLTGKANDVLLPLLGKSSVLLLDGGEHLRQRKLLLPPFHGERMARHSQLMRDATARQIESWPIDTPFALWPRMQQITLEVIIRAVFGVQDQATFEEMRVTLGRLLHVATNPGLLFMSVALGPQRMQRLPPVRLLVSFADRLIYREIDRRRKAGNLESRDDVLSLLLQAKDEDGNPMSDRELRDELMTLLVAGHETTATSLAWAMERLTRHPYAMRKLQEEVDEREPGTVGPYLDGSVKETLRLRPVISLVARELTEEAVIAGYTLPAGTRIAPCIYLMHRRADIYKDPDSFLPERWFDQSPGTYTWIPFGGGVRRCLGASFALLEMQEVLSEMVRCLEFEAVGEESEKRVRRAITQTPGNGCLVRVRPRSRSAKSVSLASA